VTRAGQSTESRFKRREETMSLTGESATRNGSNFDIKSKDFKELPIVSKSVAENSSDERIERREETAVQLR
jgi:hypothetical protein